MSNQQDLDLKRVEDHVAQLGEHFENVQIFASRFCSDESDPEAGTVSVNWGAGNWHARRGQVAEWMLKENERINAAVRRENED